MFKHDIVVLDGRGGWLRCVDDCRVRIAVETQTGRAGRDDGCDRSVERDQTFFCSTTEGRNDCWARQKVSIDNVRPVADAHRSPRILRLNGVFGMAYLSAPYTKIGADKDRTTYCLCHPTSCLQK